MGLGGIGGGCGRGEGDSSRGREAGNSERWKWGGGGISKHIYSLQLINVLIMYLCFYICRRF